MSPPFMPVYVADYRADTSHLTRSEHGAYWLLLTSMWRAGGRLPGDDDRLSRLALCTPDEWTQIKPTILEFFKRRGGWITQKRLSAELAKYDDKIVKAKRAGLASAAKKAKKVNENSTTDVQQTFNQPEPEPEPEPERQETLSNESVAAPKEPRGSRRCPEGWTVPPELIVELTVANYSPGQIERELARFRIWKFKSGRTDWPDTFRNWMENKRPEGISNVHRFDKSAAYLDSLKSVDAAMAEAVRQRTVRLGGG